MSLKFTGTLQCGVVWSCRKTTTFVIIPEGHFNFNYLAGEDSQSHSKTEFNLKQVTVHEIKLALSRSDIYDLLYDSACLYLNIGDRDSL